MNLGKRFIIDTNTLISSVLIANSIPFQALEKAQKQGTIIFSEETFLEFELVLFRKKFNRYFSADERLQIIQKVYLTATIVPVSSKISICRDPKDDKFLNLALDSGASCIISGDNDLLVLHPFNNVHIFSSSDFILQY